MSIQTNFTLVNPQNGNLAFKIFPLGTGNSFDHIQRFNYYSMILITKGIIGLKADFSEYKLSGSNLLCFAPYQPFMFSEVNGLKGLVINFHPDFFCIHKHHHEIACNGVLFNNIYEPPYLAVSRTEVQVFLTLAEQMKAEVQNAGLAQYELLVSYLKIFLIHASRLKVSLQPTIQQNTDPDSESFVLQKLREAIEQHFKNKHSAGDYAALLNISPNTLTRISKAYFNKTLTDLISERIIIEAKRELYLTSKPIKQIGYELGFNDEYYFSRFFKNNADISPQFYRNTVGFAKAEV